MDNKTLFDSVMLDETDAALLTPDLVRIADMIARAATAVEPLVNAGCVPKPDETWQAIVPATDENLPHGDTDIVPARHEITEDGLSLSGSVIVPRVV